jgi:glutamate carboxypeptidase
MQNSSCDYRPHLDWIDAQHQRMVALLHEFCAINTGTRNLLGLERITHHLREHLRPLDADVELHPLPPQVIVNSRGEIEQAPLAPALLIRKRPDRPRRIFLCIHMDTVYPADHPFQTLTQIDANTLRGPGVADAKGGLVVMLTATEALERSGLGEAVGWEMLINPDEEIGSPGSAELLAECARRSQVGLLFEPSFPDGSLVSARRGTGGYALVVHGRAAHAGREFHRGRNAIHVAAAFIVEMQALNDELPGVTVNFGRLDGGGPLNVVPDLAIARFNVRVTTPDDEQTVQQRLDAAVARINQRDGFRAELHHISGSPAKPLTPAIQRLLDHAAQCGREIGLDLRWQPSGGASDGNKLAAAGLPCLDSLCPRGGNLHSDLEYIHLDSLTERAKLTALMMMKFATGELVV